MGTFAVRRAAANCYCQLLASQSDNNVKLIVLDRLQVCAPPGARHFHFEHCKLRLFCEFCSKSPYGPDHVISKHPGSHFIYLIFRG